MKPRVNRGHYFRSVDEMSREPERRIEPELTRMERRPMTMPGEHERWENMQQPSINNPETLHPPYSSILSENPYSVLQDLPYDTGDEHNNDDYEHISEDSDGGHWDDEDGDNSSNFSSESYSPATSDSETLSECSDEEWPWQDEDMSRGGAVAHNGSLRGVIDGVVCVFTTEGNSLNTSDPWFPYIRYPCSFWWTCCGSLFNEEFCRRHPLPVAVASNPLISPVSLSNCEETHADSYS
ncbi:hypothetical protein F4859DRAFT_85554 [Xylaria cf. heliscus]|nr:hypothetical protein F4859DRAFT_85554 [Xylaria cf. heliscus]